MATPISSGPPGNAMAVRDAAIERLTGGKLAPSGGSRPRGGGGELVRARATRLSPAQREARQDRFEARQRRARPTIKGENFGQGVQNYTNRAETPFGGPS